MAACAADNGVQFIINTGDNFYCGIKNATDFQIQTDFLGPYNHKSLQVPWYGVLGNHEYGYNVEAQVTRWQISNWVMDGYYTRRVAVDEGAANVTFIFLDTPPCVQDYRNHDPTWWDPCGSDFPSCDPVDEGRCKFHENILSQSCTDQYDWFEQLAGVPDDDWLIVVGHPCYQLDVHDLYGAMMDDGKFDLYLNGHTHLLNQYEINGTTSFVTSGAGAMLHSEDQADRHNKLMATCNPSAPHYLVPGRRGLHPPHL